MISKTARLKGWFLLIAGCFSLLMIGVGCGPPGDDDDSPPFATCPPADQFEGKAWYSEAVTPETYEENVTIENMDLQIHILRVVNKVWCGIVKVQAYDIAWQDSSGWHYMEDWWQGVQAWGGFACDDPDRLDIYGWHAPFKILPQYKDMLIEPAFPGDVPQPQDESEGTMITGYFNMQAQPPTDTLYDADHVEASGTIGGYYYSVDIPEHNMHTTTLLSVDVDDWCLWLEE